MNEILDITSKYNDKEEEFVKFKKVIATNSREQDNLIKDLKRKISRQGISISENIIKLQVRDSEKLDLLSKLKAKEENIEQLNKFLTLAKEGTQKLEKEKERLKRQMKDMQYVLNQKNHQLEDIEEKCNQVEYHNQTLENSKKLLEKEINKLEAALVEQENAYKSEIRNLNLEIVRRNENIEKLNDSLDEMKKILQTVRDEKALVEIKFQEIQKTQIDKRQDEYTDMNKNLIEKIARW
jgi:chromosome segregation ATPase